MSILSFVVATSVIPAAVVVGHADLYFFSSKFCMAIDENNTCSLLNISGNTLWVPESSKCFTHGNEFDEIECTNLRNVDWNVLAEYEDTPHCSVMALYRDKKDAVAVSPVRQAIVMNNENGLVGYLPHGLITYMVPGIDDGRLQIFLVVGTPSAQRIPAPPVGKFRLLGL